MVSSTGSRRSRRRRQAMSLPTAEHVRPVKEG
jgi:hypothetical protein